MKRFLTSLVAVFFLVLNAVAGVPTMGLSSSNADYKILDGEGPQDALRRALNVNGTVHILPGTYQFTAPLTGVFNNVRITGTNGAILKPATSGSVGLFDLSGEGIKLDGFKVYTTNFVNSQSFIKFTNSKSVYIDDLIFEVATVGDPSAVSPPALVGSESTPMIGIEFSGVTRKHVQNCTFLPNYGFTGIKSTGGSGFRFTGNHFTSNTDSGYGSVNPGGSITTLSNPRLMYRGIECVGDEWGIISENRFWNLGDNNGSFALWGTNADSMTLSSNNIVDTMTRPPKPGTLFVSITHAGGSGVMRDDGAGALTFYSGTSSAITTATVDYTTGAISINLNDNITAATATTWHFIHSCILVNGTAAHTVNEEGHSIISGNRIEGIVSSGAVRLWGTNSIVFTGNMIGFLSNGPAVEGEGGLVIAGKDGNDAVNTSQIIDVFGNDFHNIAKLDTDAAHIYAKQVTRLSIRANTFALQESNYAIFLDSGTVTGPTIYANHFLTNTAQPHAIRLTSGTIASGIVIGGNTHLGYATGLVSDASNAGASGRRKILTGIQDTGDSNDAAQSITATTITFDTTAETISDSGNGLGIFVAGDPIIISGSSAQANNVACVVLTAAAGAITVSANLTTDGTAGETVTIRKLVARATTNVKLDG